MQALVDTIMARYHKRIRIVSVCRMPSQSV